MLLVINNNFLFVIYYFYPIYYDSCVQAHNKEKVQSNHS